MQFKNIEKNLRDMCNKRGLSCRDINGQYLNNESMNRLLHNHPEQAQNAERPRGYRLNKKIGRPDNGSHDTYFFVNIALGTPKLIKMEPYEYGEDLQQDRYDVIEADEHIYTNQELTFLEGMQDRDVFDSANGAAINVVRIDNLSDLVAHMVVARY